MAGQFGHKALLDARPMERVEKILKNKAFFLLMLLANSVVHFDGIQTGNHVFLNQSNNLLNLLNLPDGCIQGLS